MLFKSIFRALAVVALVGEAVDALSLRRLSRAKVLRLRKKVQSCKRVLHVTIIHPRQLGADPDTDIEADVKSIISDLTTDLIPETQNVDPFTDADADFPGFWDEFSGLTADVNTLLTDLKGNANAANTGLGQAMGLANMLKTFNSDWNIESTLDDTDTDFEAAIEALSGGFF
ncbi:hypothetical protein INS49_007202 [Diaporthe citri]|uniref:uncharacterized protein n=1 Tax=Diaporthe citri TaxID=83186 RepID=UPI001C805111|nr:uncharacterized protein INS49_007202 [Diaporthe citri]KAG6365591.1 hypothetical protein INS49_007202 [Diaporthe citri]